VAVVRSRAGDREAEIDQQLDRIGVAQTSEPDYVQLSKPTATVVSL
jgi:hypothetical protein